MKAMVGVGMSRGAAVAAVAAVVVAVAAAGDGGGAGGCPEPRETHNTDQWK